MHEEKNPSDKFSTKPPARAAIPADIKLLADVVIQLNILKKNLAIYPEGHHLISQGTAACLDALEKSFQSSSAVIIGAAKEHLFLGGKRIETKNPVFRDYALTLNRLGITALYLGQGIQDSELLRLLKILAMRPEDLKSRGDISAVLAEAGLEHVKVKLLDYSIFRHTEEAEIKGPGKTIEQPDEDPLSDMWGHFTKALRTGMARGAGGLQGEGHGGGGGRLAMGVTDGNMPVVVRGGGDGAMQHGTELDDEADDSEMSPGSIVRKLNDGSLAVDAAVGIYADMITRLANAGFRRSHIGKDSLRFFDRMNIILHNLKPQIRQRFLKSAMQNIISISDPESMEELLSCFPADLAAEMMGLAHLDGEQLSPALQKLMSKLSSVQDGIADPGDQGQGIAVREVLPFMEALKILPQREEYERHMTDDYAEQLTRLNESPADVKPPENFILDDHLESLGKQSLDMHIGRVLIALMDQDIDSTAYHDFTQKVIELVPELLDAGSFRPMFIIFSTLRQHAELKPQADVRALAKMAIQIFYEPAFVRQMVAQLADAGDDASIDLIKLLQETGQQVIPELIDVYASQQTAEGSRRLFELLCGFGSLVVDAAVARLHHRSFNYVRNLLRVIRAAGDASVIMAVRPLLKHQDQDLRYEALEVLLHFKDAGAVATVRAQLQSRSIPDISRAVLMIHKFRITGFERQLLDLVKIFMPSRRETMLNCMVLQALGELGETSVLPRLQKIAAARFTLSPGNLNKTKLALFESLALYPRGAVKELVAIGLRSGSSQIQQICRTMGA